MPGYKTLCAFKKLSCLSNSSPKKVSTARAPCPLSFGTTKCSPLCGNASERTWYIAALGPARDTRCAGELRTGAKKTPLGCAAPDTSVGHSPTGDSAPPQPELRRSAGAPAAPPLAPGGRGNPPRPGKGPRPPAEAPTCRPPPPLPWRSRREGGGEAGPAYAPPPPPPPHTPPCPQRGPHRRGEVAAATPPLTPSLRCRPRSVPRTHPAPPGPAGRGCGPGPAGPIVRGIVGVTSLSRFRLDGGRFPLERPFSAGPGACRDGAASR